MRTSDVEISERSLIFAVIIFIIGCLCSDALPTSMMTTAGNPKGKLEPRLATVNRLGTQIGFFFHMI